MPVGSKSAIARARCDYRSDNSRFLLECDFSKQYHHYYLMRLQKARPRIEANCREKWDASLPIYSLAQVATTKPAMCIVVGTIFKRMKLQPDVIEELSKDTFDIKRDRYLGHYTSQDDILTLEDAEESVQLVGKIDPAKFVTGVTIGLMGIPMDNGGKFLVHDTCFAEPSHWLSSELPPKSAHDGDSGPIYLMLVCGLGFAGDIDKDSKLTRALQDMINFVWQTGKYSNDQRGSQIGRILVAGNCLHAARSSSSDSNGVAESKTIREEKRCSSEAVALMDEFFAQLSKTVNVDVMPGPSDPSSNLMPQQPLHPCMFPKSGRFPSFNCTTNPHIANYNDVRLLATSGQNVDVISRFSGLTDPVEIMKCHLLWGNTAPSAPDNLFSVPFEDEDPFVIESAPDIYVAGCQKAFKVDYYDVAKRSGEKVKTLLLTIPEFSETFSCVLVDLNTREPQLITFE